MHFVNTQDSAVNDVPSLLDILFHFRAPSHIGLTDMVKKLKILQGINSDISNSVIKQ